jgi:uncharacterized LabA/DUF88 family protein
LQKPPFQAAFGHREDRVSTNVYVDGFNVYNGMFKRGRSPAAFKWVDPALLAMTVWPRLPPIHRVRYFTALVKPTTANPGIVARQQVYLRALVARGTEVHYGQFKLRSKNWYLKAALVQRPQSTGAAVADMTVRIAKYDEKGSDVNLASYLVRDAAVGDCTDAVVVSNDSDLVEAISIARADFGVNVYVINPQQRVVAELRQVATDARDLMPSALGKSQLPAAVTEANGTVLTKPRTWV